MYGYETKDEESTVLATQMKQWGRVSRLTKQDAVRKEHRRKGLETQPILEYIKQNQPVGQFTQKDERQLAGEKNMLGDSEGNKGKYNGENSGENRKNLLARNKKQ